MGIAMERRTAIAYALMIMLLTISVMSFLPASNGLGAPALTPTQAEPRGHAPTRDRAGTQLSADAGRDLEVLMPGTDTALPGRWCTGEIAYTVDLTVAQAHGFDPREELDLWRRAAQVWTNASDGRYTLTYAGYAPLYTGDPESTINMEMVEQHTIGVTYGTASESGNREHTEYQHSSLDGLIAGHGGISATPGDEAETSQVVRGGYVIIDAEDTRERLPDPEHRLALYIHELGHALGLAHTGDTTSVMHPEIAEARSRPNGVDTETLQVLGSLPCQR